MPVYITTTDKNLLPGNPIVMIDGTVPGWLSKECDLHFDHHRPGGSEIQLWEIPETTKLPDQCIFVTTQTDADACAAAAYLQLLQMQLDPAQMYDARANLSAIAYDCDHLGLPVDAKWNPYRDFAAKAVAALKESGNDIARSMELPANRKEWSDAEKIAYASKCFESGSQWLIDACLGLRPFPGENGEADAYFARMEAQRAKVYENCRLYRGVVVFDQRSFDGYVDPRLLVEWARENNSSNITLTVRGGSRQPNAAKTIEAFNYQAIANGQNPLLDENLYSYTLGSVPLHAGGSPKFSDREIWKVLAGLEIEARQALGIEPPETQWGGRNEVGGSSWRDPAIATPEQVIDVVLGA